MIRIPLTDPSLLFSIQVPRPWSGFVERPVLDDGKVLLAGDDASAACVDGNTGRTIYHLTLPLDAADRYAGMPLPRDDGRALVPVYQKDDAIRIYDVSPAGAIGLVDLPGAEEQARGRDMKLAGHDASCKLFLMPLARGAGDHYLISWIYRQVRFYRTECRSLGRGLAWGSDEAMVAVTEDVVLGVTPPVRGTNDRGMLVARSVSDGRALWSLGARSRTVAGTGNGMFFLLDRSARVAEDAARRITCDEELLEALAEEPSLMGDALDNLQRNLLAQRPVRAPSRVVAIDAVTGEERWEANVPGDVVSIAGPGGGLLAVVSVTGTEAHLHRVDAATGELRGASSLGAGWPGSPFDPWSGRLSFELWSNEMPAIAGIDEQAIVWSSPEALFAERLTEPFDRLWRWSLPAPCRGFRPRVLDRVLNEPSIRVGDGRIYLRDGWSLWGIGERR